MAFYQLLCGFTVMIILSSKGCQSQHPSCGQAGRNTSIVGGQDAPPGDLPWIVTLNLENYPFCSGSLIGDQWVLTTATCIIGYEPFLKVSLGQDSLSSESPKLNVEWAIYHPAYFSSSENDIALLKLSTPVKFTDDIYPICLPSANSTLPTGTNSWTAEWVQNLTDFTFSDLRNVKVQTVGNNECKQYHPQITENMLCAGVNNTCAGHRGAPLMIRDGPVWVQIGIHSSCDSPPALYTRVSQYLDWMNRTMVIPHKDGSVFDSGENVIHFSHFTHFLSLCVLVLSLFVLVGDS